MIHPLSASTHHTISSPLPCPLFSIVGGLYREMLAEVFALYAACDAAFPRASEGDDGTEWPGRLVIFFSVALLETAHALYIKQNPHLCCVHLVILANLIPVLVAMSPIRMQLAFLAPLSFGLRHVVYPWMRLIYMHLAMTWYTCRAASVMLAAKRYTVA